MDFTNIIDPNIINTLLNFASIALFVVGVLTALTNIVVEVFKGMFPKLPTNILVFIVSIVITILALIIAAAILDITIMWHYAIGTVILGIVVAYAAMGNFKNLQEIVERLKEYRKG